MDIPDAIIQSFSQYYGLDWMALVMGVTGTYMLTSHNRCGFLVTALACAAGFATSMISGQFGYVLYNGIVIAMMTRGFIAWGRLAPQAAE